MAPYLSPRKWPPGLPLADWNQRLKTAYTFGAIRGWQDVYWKVDGQKITPVEVEPGQLVWGDMVSVRPMGSSGEYHWTFPWQLRKSLHRALDDRRRNGEAAEIERLEL